MSTKIRPLIPPPPPLRPTWTTYMWLGFAIAVAVAMIVGFGWMSNRPFVH